MGTAALGCPSSEARLATAAAGEAAAPSLPFAYACTANGAAPTISRVSNESRRFFILFSCLAPWRVNRTFSNGRRSETPATADFPPHRHSHIVGRRRAECRRARIPAGMQYVPDFLVQPRQWAPYELGELQCAEMNRLRARYDLKPLVIHTNYLVNSASSN